MDTIPKIIAAWGTQQSGRTMCNGLDAGRRFGEILLEDTGGNRVTMSTPLCWPEFVPRAASVSRSLSNLAGSWAHCGGDSSLPGRWPRSSGRDFHSVTQDACSSRQRSRGAPVTQSCVSSSCRIQTCLPPGVPKPHLTDPHWPSVEPMGQVGPCSPVGRGWL